MKLTCSLQAWGTANFKSTLSNEMKNLPVDELPLQQALLHGNYASVASLDVMVIGAKQQIGVIQVKAGLFYTSVLAGCNCANDPAADAEFNEYCEVQIEINTENADAVVRLLQDS